MVNRPRLSLPRAAWRLIIAIACMLLLFMAVAWLLPLEKSRMLFIESGPIESASIVLWLGATLVVLLALRPLTPAVFAGVFLCLCCAAREADLHKKLTDDSMLKISYYIGNEHPVVNRAVAALVFIALVLSFILVMVRVTRNMRRASRRPLPLWTVAVAAVGLLIVTTKVIDRLPKIMEDEFGVLFNERMRVVLRAFEEGGELIVPIVVATAVIGFAMHMTHRADAPLNMQAERA